ANLKTQLFPESYVRYQYVLREREIFPDEKLFSPNVLTLLNPFLLRTKAQDFQIVQLPRAGCILPLLLNDLNNPFFIYTLLTVYCVTCRPHSFLLWSSHHHLPARKSSPSRIARVQGWQPILGKPLSCKG